MTEPKIGAHQGQHFLKVASEWSLHSLPKSKERVFTDLYTARENMLKMAFNNMQQKLHTSHPDRGSFNLSYTTVKH